MSPASSQEERGRRLLDAMPAIAWSASADTFRFNYISPAAEALLGYPVQRWLDEPDFWVAHLHPDDRYVAMICHNETLAQRPHQLVYRMVAADGRSVWLRDYVNVHSVDGRPEELFGVMVDITREREAEEAWKESRENFRRMVELSPDCMGVQVDGTYRYVNPALVSLLGAQSDQEVLGASALSFVHPDYIGIAQDKLDRAGAGEAVPYGRSKWRRVDETYVDVEVAALPLRYDSRDAVHVIARDITDRVRAETELQVREERLDLLASGTHEAIWEWFPSRRELWTNDAYRQMLGATPAADQFFDEWLTRIHPDDRYKAGKTVMCAMTEAKPVWWHEYRFRHADGTERYILDRGHTVTSPSGEPRVIGALLDVTSLRESERMRAAAEAKFRWLVEQSVVAVYMMSGNRLTYINDTGALMLGYTAEQLKTMDLATLLQGDDDPGAVFGGRPNVARIRRGDGSIVHIAFYPNEVTIDGEPIIIGTGADITDSVHAQQALADSERRYRELVEDVTDVLYTADEEGRLTSLSRSFERITGFRVDDWIGRPFTELFAKQLLTAAPPPEPSGDDRIIREYELVTRGGAVLRLEVSSQPRYVKGVLTGTIGMARDVTEQRNAARTLEEAKRMSSLGQVAASLAHEFNNVLMGIQPFVEVISRNVAMGRPIHDALGHITRAIARGKRASQEILRFASPNEPQLRAIDAQVWLPSLLGQLAATLPPTVRITSSVAPDVRFIRGDREHLEQVITNLVFNARDAIANDGTIDVAVSVEGALVRLSISDNGCGIAPAMLDRIFEPLFTTKRNGTGLGLAIARRLMERQGGALTADNRTGGGSVFHVLVPAASSAPAAAVPVLRMAPNVRRILIVEDDPSVATGLESLLQSEGYETMWVASAAEACEAAWEMTPQVAIIDVNLPDGNGADLVPVLRAQHEGLPVILSTGHVELNVSDKKQRILSLLKPYELSELLNAIGTVTAPA